MAGGFPDFVKDSLSSFGIQLKKMFGGYGIYKNGLMFALIADDELYFKVGEKNKKDFEERNSEPFSYEKKSGIATINSYWRVPADIIDEAEELAKWAEKSYSAAILSKTKKK